MLSSIRILAVIDFGPLEKVLEEHSSHHKSYWYRGPEYLNIYNPVIVLIITS